MKATKITGIKQAIAEYNGTNGHFGRRAKLMLNLSSGEIWTDSFIGRGELQYYNPDIVCLSGRMHDAGYTDRIRSTYNGPARNTDPLEETITMSSAKAFAENLCREFAAKQEAEEEAVLL